MTEQVFVVRDSPLKLFRLALFAFAFSVAAMAGLGLFGENPWPKEPDAPYLLGMVAVGFGLAGAVLTYRSLTANEAYRIDRGGYALQRSSLFRGRRSGWPKSGRSEFQARA